MTLPGGIKSLFAKRLQTLRARLLVGSLVFVFVIWAMDRLSQAQVPASAKASLAPRGAAYLIPDPPDRAALENFLSGEVTLPPPLDTSELRDPFVPNLVATRENEDARELVADLAAPNSTLNLVEPQSAHKPFDQSHRLQGVVFGARPYAMIDGKSYRVGDRIEGYRISSIQRDHVILQSRQEVAMLRMARPSLDRQAGSP